MQPRVSLSRLLLLVLLASLLPACTGQLVPVTPRAPVVANGLAARVIALDAPRSGKHPVPRTVVRIALDEVPPGGGTLTQAYLVSTSVQPCTGGKTPREIEVERADTQHLVPGAVLAIDFPRWFQQVADEASRVDLLFTADGKPECLALDLTSPKPELAWKYDGQWAWTFGMGIMAYTHAVNGSSAMAAIASYVGRWMGPLRLAVGTALALDGCIDPACPEPSYTLSSDVAIPLLARADVFPLQAQDVALGVGARYSFLVTWKDPTDSARATAYQLASVAPIFAITAPKTLGNGIHGGLREGALEISVPMGMAATLDGHGSPAFAMGLFVEGSYAF